MAQKLLKKPLQMLLIAFVSVPAMNMAVQATAPRVSLRQVASQRLADTARQRAREELYLNEGIERWGLNE